MLQKFWILLVLWILLRAALLYCAWEGDVSPQSRDRVLRFFSETDILKGREYLKVSFAARVVGPFLSMTVLLILVFGKYANRFHGTCENFTGGGFWTTGILFLLAFFALLQLVSLPFDYYMGFICEKRMGFSNMTSEQWVLRYLKGIMVSWLIQGLGIMLILWLLKTFSRSWPLQVPVATTIFGIILTLMFPILVTPLFYAQKPLADGPLKTRILEIAGKARIPVEGIYEIDESRYSSHTNAYFTGLFSRKQIVLFDTLVKSHTVDEAALIFAHEVGHWLHDHTFLGLAFGFLGTLAGSIALWFLFPFLSAVPEFGLKEIWSAANAPFFAILFHFCNLFFAPCEAQISQWFERQADRASLELTGLSKVFSDAEVRLARDNRGDLLPHPFRVFWLYSHPPAIDRIQTALDFQATPASGTTSKIGN